MNGFSWKNFSISDEVMITLIGTTTVNIIGLLAIVIRYLFPSKSN